MQGRFYALSLAESVVLNLKMRQFLLSITLVTVSLPCFSQFEEPVEFVDFKTEIENLSSADTSLRLDKWEYRALLFLDASVLSIVEENYHDIANSYSEYFAGNKFDTLLVIERNDLQDVKDCFSDLRVLTEMLKTETWLRRWPADRIYHRIYVKDNSAVYEIYGDSWSELNIVTLTDKEIVIRNVTNVKI